jgi:hypothetical protein
MAEVSEHHLILVQLDLIKVVLSAILNAPPASPVSVQSAGRTALQDGKILELNVKRSLMVEPPGSQSILVLQDTINLVLFATPIARQATMESDQFAGNLALLVGLILVRFAVSQSISMEKDVAVLFSVAVIIAEMVTLMMVALAEDLPKLWLNLATVMALVSHWAAQATKILMEDSATPNARMVTKESVQSAGRFALRAILTPEQPALNQPRPMVLESQ